MLHACSVSVFLSITPTRRVAGRLRSTTLGFATAELLLPKRIFSVSLKWGVYLQIDVWRTLFVTVYCCIVQSCMLGWTLLSN